MNPKTLLADASAGAEHARIAVMTLYKVEFNSDSTEGRGRAFYEWYINHETATRVAKGQYVMGTDCPIHRVAETVVISGDKVWLLGAPIGITWEDPRETRARALAKLTPEERKILGV